MLTGTVHSAIWILNHLATIYIMDIASNKRNRRYNLERMEKRKGGYSETEARKTS